MPRTIRSNSDPSTSWPWFEFTIDGDEVTFTKANGLSVAIGKAPPQGEKGMLKAHPLSRSTDVTVPEGKDVAPADEVHALAVTLEGDVEFVPASQQQPVYYAHLAWQYADGTWDRVKFVEGGT